MQNYKVILVILLINNPFIGLVDSKEAFFRVGGVYAQQANKSLLLEKNGNRIVIPVGDWIMITDATNPNISPKGILGGVDSNGLTIRTTRNGYGIKIPLENIGAVYHGKIKPADQYMKRGMRYGCLVGWGLGFLSATDSYDAGGIIGGDGSTGALVAFTIIDGVIYNIITVPVGAIIGLVQSQLAKGNAKHYGIGSNEWQIVQ